jgi:homoserine O-succinyltransferase/O-acetyltransferase
MPVVLEKGARGRGPAPLNRTRSDGAIEIAIVNNMPDSALESTERQFIELLAAASAETLVRVSLFSLPQITRGDLARRRVLAEYADIDSLQHTRPDGIIVTGMEPGPGPLADESYWCAFTDLIDWAERTTTSSIWSCLAAHAVVLHRDGIGRRPLSAKCFGVYECMKQTDHLLLAGAPARARSPHSRWNDVPEDALAGAGYTILTRSPEIGVDMFVKCDRSLFVLLQGHPEYDSATLLREYRRDVGRFLRREREDHPALPRHYLDGASERSLQEFRCRALSVRDPELLEVFSVDAIAERITNSWRASATRLYRRWLAYLSERRERSPLLAAPVPMRSD